MLIRCGFSLGSLRRTDSQTWEAEGMSGKKQILRDLNERLAVEHVAIESNFANDDMEAV